MTQFIDHLGIHMTWKCCPQWIQMLRPGSCITNVIATCHKNFSQWERSFLWKLRCHRLKFLRHVAKTLVIQDPGPHLSIKTIFPRYEDFHVKDKTVSRKTISSLTWGSLYWQDDILILRWPPEYPQLTTLCHGCWCPGSLCRHVLRNPGIDYRKISNIRRTKSPNLDVSRLVVQLSSPNPVKPGVKSRMKM